jgi:hypothetical protein
MRSELQKEGLIQKDSRWRKYFLFFLLPALIAGGVSVPLLMNRYGIDWNYFSKEENSNVSNLSEQSSANDNAVATNTLQEGPFATGENLTGRGNARAEENNETATADIPGSDARLVALNAGTTTPEAGNTPREAGVTDDKNTVGENKVGGAEVIDSKKKPEEGNKPSDTAPVPDASGDKPVADESPNVPSLTPQPPENTSTVNSGDSIPITKKEDDTLPDSSEKKPEPKDTTVKLSGFNSKPWIGIYASWDFTSYHLRENSNFATEAGDIINSASIEGESSLEQYTIGIMGGLRMTPKLALEAGALFSQKRKLNDIISTDANANSNGEESFSDFVYCYNAKYVEAYGRVKYYIIEKKQSFYVTAGAVGSFNFPSRKDDRGYFERTTFSEVSPPQTDRITLEASSAGLSIVVSAGMEISLKGRWNLFIEPGYRHALTPVILHPDYEKLPVEHFWRTFSVGTGLMYKF